MKVYILAKNTFSVDCCKNQIKIHFYPIIFVAFYFKMSENMHTDSFISDTK